MKFTKISELKKNNYETLQFFRTLAQASQITEDSEEFLFFHIEECTVYLDSTDSDTKFNIIGGAGREQCPNPIVNVVFQQKSRIQGLR